MHPIEASRPQRRLQASSWARRLSSSRWRLEPEEESGHFPPKCAVPRTHPRRLVDLFGEVHDPRLKPEGLVETVGDLAEVMVHGRLLPWRVLVMGRWISSAAPRYRSPVRLLALHDEHRRIPEPALDPAGAKRGASLLVSARGCLLPPVVVRLREPVTRDWDIRRRQDTGACPWSSALS